ncbi:MAG TPA: patatin-like phospholipase family protein, partial [Variovorax sp.]
MSSPQSHPAPATALVLTGGGARAAYQVGVLQALARLHRGSGPAARANPFPIISGSSAGAINAAALACGADDFGGAVRRIARVWAGLEGAQIYRADALSVLSSSDTPWARVLSAGWMIARWRRTGLHSLLDISPLRLLLEKLVPLNRLPGLIDQGHLGALAVSASSYNSGAHVTFYQSGSWQEPWTRSNRISTPAQIGLDHLLASSAIPFVFPAAALEIGGRSEYFGDGSMRQSAPLAAAIHLGAERILAIGAGRMKEPDDALGPNALSGYPTLAQVAGHALSSIFLDALTADVERLERVNATLALIPPEARSGTPLRRVELLVIAPSQRIDQIAARHANALPAAVRGLLAEPAVPTDAAHQQGSALASYL